MSTETARRWTVADLPALPTGAIQRCRICREEYSTTPGDYFLLAPTTVLTCCDQPVAIVLKRTEYREVL